MLTESIEMTKKQSREGTLGRLTFAAGLGLSTIALAGITGCQGAQDFRAAANSSLEIGLDAIADGLIDGLFAVMALEDSTTGT